MLLYLINVVDNTWLLALLGPLALRAVRGGPNRGPAVRRAIFAAVALGALAAAIYSILRRNVGWVIREFYNLGVLVPAISSLFALIVVSQLPKSAKKSLAAARAASALAISVFLYAALWRFFGLKGLPLGAALFSGLFAIFSFGPLRIEDLFWPALAAAAFVLASMLARTLPNIILYPLDFGVGLDSVFNIEYISKVGGYSLGLAVMAFLWLSVSFICRQAPSRVVRWVALAALLTALFQLCLEAGQILAARRLIPRFWFGVVLWLLERENGFFWIQAFLWGGLSAGLMARSRAAVPVGANPALRRKAKAGLRSDFRSGMALAMSLALVLVTATTLRAVSRRGPVIADPTEVKASEGGGLVMDLEPLSDGNLHRLVYNSATGTPVRFIVIKKSQSAYGVGLDACDICGQSGYYQRGDQVICKLCDVVMNKSTIGFPGGCNPVPLAFELSGGKMLIKTSDLDSEAHRFK
jgi:uncharacterized membrane protein